MGHLLKTGVPVIYLDSQRKAHHALVTTFHGVNNETMTEDEYEEKWHTNGPPCANLVWVDSDESKTDSHGRQIYRASSISHGDSQSPPRLGSCYLWPDEYED